jgi:mannose-6-phosphate isomerase-like protein (cupin superfamily)
MANQGGGDDTSTASGLATQHITTAHFHGRTPPPGNLAIPALAHGSMIVEYYAPRGTDRQMPHTRDELYIIIAGQGTFKNGDAQHPFTIGDVIFVAAGIEHRFVEFTDDFATWVIFYGPEGGESA